MSKEIKKKEIFIFKKGDIVLFDSIYHLQGLLSGDWWEHKDNDVNSTSVVITRNIHLEITEYK